MNFTYIQTFVFSKNLFSPLCIVFKQIVSSEQIYLFEEITNKLNKKEEKGIFSKFISLFSSSKKKILLSAPSERNEIKPIFLFELIYHFHYLNLLSKFIFFS